MRPNHSRARLLAALAATLLMVLAVPAAMAAPATQDSQTVYFAEACGFAGSEVACATVAYGTAGDDAFAYFTAGAGTDTTITCEDLTSGVFSAWTSGETPTFAVSFADNLSRVTASATIMVSDFTNNECTGVFTQSDPYAMSISLVLDATARLTAASGTQVLHQSDGSSVTLVSTDRRRAAAGRLQLGTNTYDLADGIIIVQSFMSLARTPGP